MTSTFSKPIPDEFVFDSDFVQQRVNNCPDKECKQQKSRVDNIKTKRA